jgi:fructoselysine-6-P-deglycase FrlB-like protein
MNRFLQDILEQPAELHKVLDRFTAQRDELDQAARLVTGAARVVLTSMGSAYYSLMPMAFALQRLHPNVQLVETSELMRQPFFPGTLYIIMSRSGESGEIAAFSQTLHERGEPLIAVTMTPDSTLARNASLLLHDPASYDGFICTKAYSSMTLVGLLVASQLEGGLNERLIRALHHTFDWMEAEKNRLLAQIEDLAWLGESLTFLSRGAGMATAASGVLWLEEASRLRGSFAGIDFYMHGPVEQVDTRYRGVWIDLLPDAVSCAHYQSCASRGGRLLVLAPEGGCASTAPDAIPFPDFDLPEPYRVLPVCMPIQMIAYRSAALQGLEAGEMRYLDWIVK